MIRAGPPIILVRVEGNTVSANDNTQRIVRHDDDKLAEIIERPVSDAPSFYQRNSGSLPKSETDITAHRRSELPTPESPDTVSLMDSIRSLLRR